MTETQNVNEKTHQIVTKCRDCYFAEFDYVTESQVGCNANRLEKFEALGKIKEVTDKETDLSYYEIQTVCNLLRQAEWANDKDYPLTAALEEVRLKLSFILLVKSWKDVVSLECLLSQTSKPEKIVIVAYACHSLPTDLLERLKKSGIPHDVVNVIDSPDLGNLIDSGVRRIKSLYYTVVEEGYILPLDFIQKLNSILNDELRPFSMIAPDDQLSGLTVQTRLHNLIGGNNNEFIRTKIETLAKDQNLSHMILSLDQIQGN